MAIADIEQYFRSWDRESYEVVAQQGSEPTAEDLEEFEGEVGFRLPDEFREFALHPLGGLYMQVKETIWPAPREFDVGPFWTFLRGLMVYGLSSEAPDWLQLRPAWRELGESGGGGLVPFLKLLGDADPYCFTPEGRIAIWRHETPDEPEPVDGATFSEVLMKEIRELDERKARKLRGEDRKG
jgi:hypothetical protein